MEQEHKKLVASEKCGSEIDKAVGARVRQRRSALKISQERLSEMIGVSFQQLQKYEAGTNRMGASRLFDIAVALDTPIGFFFGEDDADAAGKCGEVSGDTAQLAKSLSDILEDAATFEIVQTFSSITDHHLRRQLVSMLEAFLEKVERDVRRGKHKA